MAEKIVKISLDFPNINIIIPYKKILIDYLKNKYNTSKLYGAKSKCPAGDTFGYINANLEYYPCPYINVMKNNTKKYFKENKITTINNNFNKFKELEKINM